MNNVADVMSVNTSLTHQVYQQYKYFQMPYAVHHACTFVKIYQLLHLTVFQFSRLSPVLHVSAPYVPCH